MKKRITILTISVILLLFAKANAASEITPFDAQVYLKGEAISFSMPLMSYNGRTLVPMRELFEKLGATVEWVNDEKKIIATSETKVIEMWIDNLGVTCNGIDLFTDAPPILYQNKTLIPLRFVSEQMNLSVVWDAETKTITLDTIGNVTIGTVSKTFWSDINKCEIYKEYTGELLNGVPTGIGTMQHIIIQNDKTTQSTREGCFKNWLENGWVNTISSNGVLTYGYYDSGIPVGDFIILYPSGDHWLGSVLANGEEICIPHGEGIYTFPDSSKYLCNMQFASLNGYGELYDPQGNLIYAGEHKDGAFHGYGKLYGEGGSLVYEGEFKNGAFSGQGNLYNANGFLIYSGTFPIQNTIYDYENQYTYDYDEIEEPSFITEWKQFDSSLEQAIDNSKKAFDVSLYNSSEARKIYKKYNLDTSWIIDGVLIGFDSFKGANARTEYEKQEYEKYKEKYEYHKMYVPIANNEIKAMFGY